MLGSAHRVDHPRVAVQRALAVGNPIFEREETRCDFQDNDCDGQIDEGLRNGCNFCGPEPLEACNHLDDDCDGIEDEGCPVDPNSQRIREP